MGILNRGGVMQEEEHRLLSILEDMQIELKKAYWVSEKRTWYLLWRHFIAGLAKGLGTALGATIIAAIAFYILGVLANLNLPVISQFLARLVKLTQMHM